MIQLVLSEENKTEKKANNNWTELANEYYCTSN